MHRNSLLIFEKYAVPHLREPGHMLEISPHPYPSDFYRSLEQAGQAPESYTVCSPWNDWPEDARPIRMIGENELEVRGEAFDTLLSANVIEHVRRPWIWIGEMVRVLKRGGLIVLLCPQTWKIHPCKSPWHHKTDCWRILPHGFDVLFQEANLEPIITTADSLDNSCEDDRNQRPQGRPWDVIGIARK